MRPRLWPFLRIRLLAMGIMLAAACGSSSQAPTAPTAPSPVPPTGQDVSFSDSVSAYGTSSHNLSVTVDGTLTATLTWGNGAVDLDLYLTDANCSGYAPADCAVLAKSVAESGTREEITRRVKLGDRYILWVDNLARTTASSYSISGSVR